MMRAFAALREMHRDRGPAVQLALRIERNEPAVALLHRHGHILHGRVVEAGDGTDLGGEIDAERVGRLGGAVQLAGGEQRLEELLAVEARSFGFDVEHLIVAHRGGDLDMGQPVDREIGEIELLEALRRVERHAALNIDVVADDSQIGEVGRAVRLGHDIQHERRGCGRQAWSSPSR